MTAITAADDAALQSGPVASSSIAVGRIDKAKARTIQTSTQAVSTGASRKRSRDEALLVDANTDGFRWRKYGKTVPKGMALERHYFKCNKKVRYCIPMPHCLILPKSMVTCHSAKGRGLQRHRCACVCVYRARAHDLSLINRSALI